MTPALVNHPRYSQLQRLKSCVHSSVVLAEDQLSGGLVALKLLERKQVGGAVMVCATGIYTGCSAGRLPAASGLTIACRAFRCKGRLPALGLLCLQLPAATVGGRRRPMPRALTGAPCAGGYRWLWRAGSDERDVSAPPAHRAAQGGACRACAACHPAPQPGGAQGWPKAPTPLTQAQNPHAARVLTLAALFPHKRRCF